MLHRYKCVRWMFKILCFLFKTYKNLVKTDFKCFFLFQDLSQGPLSQGALSQGPLTQGGMSQQMHPLSQPLSQPELSQVRIFILLNFTVLVNPIDIFSERACIFDILG